MPKQSSRKLGSLRTSIYQIKLSIFRSQQSKYTNLNALPELLDKQPSFKFCIGSYSNSNQEPNNLYFLHYIM